MHFPHFTVPLLASDNEGRLPQRWNFDALPAPSYPRGAGARCSLYCATSPDLYRPTLKGCYYFDSNCTPVQPSKCGTPRLPDCC
jgi:hypothetical protein